MTNLLSSMLRVQTTYRGARVIAHCDREIRLND